MAATAEFRHVTLTPLLPRLADMPAHAQTKWARWRAREERFDLPEAFVDILQSIASFVDPVVSGTADHSTWNHRQQAWK